MICRAFFLALLLAAGLAQAQAYRWVDKNGRVQFTDAPPPSGAKDVQKLAPAAEAGGGRPQMPYELARAVENFPVVLYTAPNCKESCDAVRDALNKRGVPFKEVQVYDQASIEELKRVSGGQGVPTLLVGHSMQRGFEQDTFDTLLDSAGYPKAGVLPPLSQKAPPAPESDASAASAKAPPPQETPRKAGPYDTSGLTGPAPKPGPYDPSGLVGPPPKQGQYGIPGEAK